MLMTRANDAQDSTGSALDSHVAVVALLSKGAVGTVGPVYAGRTGRAGPAGFTSRAGHPGVGPGIMTGASVGSGSIPMAMRLKGVTMPSIHISDGPTFSMPTMNITVLPVKSM